MTPRLMTLILEGRIAALDREHNGRALLAWNVAALQRAKRLRKSDLQSMMAKRRRRRKQTLDEQRTTMRMFAATYGGRK